MLQILEMLGHGGAYGDLAEMDIGCRRKLLHGRFRMRAGSRAGHRERVQVFRRQFEPVQRIQADQKGERGVEAAGQPDHQFVGRGGEQPTAQACSLNGEDFPGPGVEFVFVLGDERMRIANPVERLHARNVVCDADPVIDIGTG